MGGEMDDMDLDVPPPPPPAGSKPEPPMDDDMNPEEDKGQEDPIAGGPDDDPMAGDPDALSAGSDEGGEGDEISQKYERLSSDQKHAADKYIDSMLNDDDQGGDMNTPQMESRFNFKHIIDEVFGEVEKEDNFKSTTRNGKVIEDSAETEQRSPFIPR